MIKGQKKGYRHLKEVGGGKGKCGWVLMDSFRAEGELVAFTGIVDFTKEEILYVYIREC